MASKFKFTVSVELEREQGKFMSRDEMEEQLLEALESADPGEINGGADGDSAYSVIDWDVSSG